LHVNTNIELSQKDELQQIRQFWLRDPNEPDWADSLPAIYRSVFDKDINWVENDAGAFTEPDAILLKEIELEHGAPAEMAINGSGMRDTARVLKINKDTVINTLKKRKASSRR